MPHRFAQTVSLVGVDKLFYFGFDVRVSGGFFDLGDQHDCRIENVLGDFVILERFYKTLDGDSEPGCVALEVALLKH